MTVSEIRCQQALVSLPQSVYWRHPASWIASLCCGVATTNISTLLNWCSRYNPRVAAPAAPASVRKQWLNAAML